MLRRTQKAIDGLRREAHTNAMTDETHIWRIALEIPEAHVGAFDAALEPYVDSLMWTVDDARTPTQHMEGFATVQPDRALLTQAVEDAARACGIDAPAVTVEELAPRDWVAENLKDFPPIDQGRFFIHGEHVDERPLPGRIPLRIDPGAAFGTGTHATTAGCLQAIEDLGKRRSGGARGRRPFKRPLDVGAGSGILAIAMAKLWRVAVLGTDIDPKAVAVARANARFNGVDKLVTFKAGPGFAPVPVHARFDLIVANILARPLTALAPDVAGHLARGGYAVLSGLIVRDERLVVAAYMAQGLKFKSRYVRDGWVTLVMQKR